MTAIPHPENEFSITRTFNAPRTLVWQAWTDAKHLAEWWGPKGANIEVKTLDLKPGGVFLYCMRMPNGQALWGKFVYHEIVPPERMVFDNCFSDEDGGVTRNPWAPTWPLEVHNIMTLAEEGGKTTLSLRGGPINATAEEQATFNANRDGMRAGFGGTFDQLDAYLEKLQG